MRDPGEFSRRISLLEITRTPDGGGGFIEAEAILADLWAKVEPLVGTEQTQAMQTGVLRPHRFTIPFRAGLESVTSIRYRARKFDVKNIIDPGSEGYELVLLADEVHP